MAQQEKLRFRAEMDTKNFEAGVSKVNRGLKRTAGSSKKSGQAMTQLAYALDDAQYGFRGVQNNIQAIAVSSGLGGPLVLAITAATAVIGYFVTKWEKATKAAREYAKELTKAQGPIAETLIWIDVMEKASSGSDTHKLALLELKNRGYDPLTMSVDQFTASLKRQAITEAALAASKGKISELLKKEIDARETLKKLDKIAGDISIGDDNKLEKTGFLSSFNVRKYNKALAVIAQTPAELSKISKQAAEVVSAHLGEDGAAGFILAGKNKGGAKKAASKGRDKLKSVIVEAKGTTIAELKKWQTEARKTLTVLADAFGEDLTKVGDVVVENGDDIANKLRGVAKKLGHTVAPVVKEANEIGQALQSSLSSAFIGVGEAIGEALVNGFEPGDFIKLLGAFMQQFGAALIAIGVAELALKFAAVNPVAAIAAGVALVAAGAAISSARSNNPASKGGGGSNPYSNAGSVTPSRIQGFGDSGQLVATVRGTDLRFMLQGANDVYQAKN